MEHPGNGRVVGGEKIFISLAMIAVGVITRGNIAIRRGLLRVFS